MFNVACYLITELVPYLVIFILNYKNLSQIGKYDEFAEQRMK